MAVMERFYGTGRRKTSVARVWIRPGTGWLVPPGDVRALATALRRAIDVPRDWPALRRRCRAYVESRTLEAWVRQIGEFCAGQWNVSLIDGKLRL